MAARLIVTVLLVLPVVANQGFDLNMDRPPRRVGNSTICAQLHCYASSGSSNNITTLIKMNVYRIQNSNEKILLATVLARESDIQAHTGIDTTVVGSMSESSGELNLTFSGKEDCNSGNFSCEIQFKNSLEVVDVWEKFTSPPEVSSPDVALTARLLQKDLSDLEVRIASFLSERLAEVESTIRRANALEIAKVKENQHKLESILANLSSSFFTLTHKPEAKVEPATFLKRVPVCVKAMNKSLDARAIAPVDNIEVMCDTETDCRGWIIIQRRVMGDVSFDRPWADYKKGFGSFYGDFWLGLEAIATLTKKENFELRIDLRFKGSDYYAKYGIFRVMDETSLYRIRVGGNFSGNAPNALRLGDNVAFSTYDRDYDTNGNINWALFHSGGWWYHHSTQLCNLNGVWETGDSNKEIFWENLRQNFFLTFVEMKIRMTN
ncbi:unnamed protein product [Lymnaea stagnalis]|uniref:Fibrinogen C-terminal domain-containing protein n=1 Tax=Lymnaea stagnalis TaxID=6523 RepID=A0AAV2ID74_LYMST